MNEKNEEMNLNFEVEQSIDFQNNERDFFESSNVNIFEKNFFSHVEDELPEIYYWMTAQSTQEVYEKIDEPIKLENEPENKIFSKDVHSKENDDNIRRKIKCHFHNFIINYFNNLIKEKKKRKFKI